MALEIASLELPLIPGVTFPTPGRRKPCSWCSLRPVPSQFASTGAEEFLEGVREEELCGRKGRSVTAPWPAARGRALRVPGLGSTGLTHPPVPPPRSLPLR